MSASLGTGALAAQAADVTGAGLSASAGTGALAAQAASIAGTGASVSTGIGALAAQTAAVAGAGTVSSAGDITGTGALIAGSASIAGLGEVSSPGLGGTLVPIGGGRGGRHTRRRRLVEPVLAEITGEGALISASASVSGMGTVAPSERQKRNRRTLMMLLAA